MEIGPGTILLGKYRVDELIGVGGMGRVVRASHLYLQQSVAIKILLPQMTESDSTVERFLREAQNMVLLKSEHTARVIDVGTMPDRTPFMVMEYLAGNDLNQILRHHGPQTPQVVVDLMLQACEGIAEAHALGIIHRDIKPSNFFITQRPDGSMLLKILDFGISKTPVGVEDLTGTQTVIGTPSYMAPEQMKSGRAADARSDIWSMGVVMYQLLQGRPPFVGESYADLVLKVGLEPPQPLHVALPAGLGEVIFRCLEKDPKLRFQNVAELARSLAPFSTDPVSAAQIAGRTMRILAQRPSVNGMNHGQQVMPLSAGGGLVTPAPLSPAQLTPHGWPPTTSQGAGRGQVTYRSGEGKRGWLIAGVTGLVILAGAGGYIASQLGKKTVSAGAAPSPAPDEPAATPTPPADTITSAGTPRTTATPAAPPPPAPTTTTPPPAAPAPPAPSASTPAGTAAAPSNSVSAPVPPTADAIKPATTKTASTSTSVVTGTPSTPTKSSPAKATATATKASATKPSTTKPKTDKKKSKKDDLFDSRH